MLPAGLPDEGLVCDVGGMGAPTVSVEKLDAHEAEVRGGEGVGAMGRGERREGGGGGWREGGMK